LATLDGLLAGIALLCLGSFEIFEIALEVLAILVDF